MIDFNNLINDIITTKISCITSLKLFLFIIFALIISLIIDMAFGELPTRIHPVVVMGSIINFFKRLFIGIKNRIFNLFNLQLEFRFVFHCFCNTIVIDIFSQYAVEDCR